MQNIRSSNTAPELIIMRALKRRRIYFASHPKNIIGKPDIVFRRKKIAIFIDSDFWHGHPERFVMPKSNIVYWKNKIELNKKRDEKVNQELKENGWRVIRFWEHQVNKDAENCIDAILKAISVDQS